MVAYTPCDLFRAGNKTSARLDVIRPGEVSIVSIPGQPDIVKGRSGGVSTFDAAINLGGTWWRLPAGTPYDDSIIFLHNDAANHWSWEPIRDMPLSSYRDELSTVNAKFIP